MTRRMLTLLILLNVQLSLAAEPITFQNLKDHLTEQQLNKFIERPQDLELAKNGDLVTQIYILLQMTGEEWDHIAYPLITQIYHEHGLALEGVEYPAPVLQFYGRLGIMSLEGEVGTPDPVLGFRLLTHAARYLGDYYSSTLAYRMDYSGLLPNTANLSELWEQYQPGQPGVDLDQVGYHYDDDTPELPDASLFQRCDNALGRSSEIVAEFEHQQNRLLSDGNITPATIKAAYAAIVSSQDGFGAETLTLNFQNFNVRGLFNLMFDAMGDSETQLHFDASLPNYSVMTHTDDVPLIVLYALVMEQFKLTAHCHQNWVRFSGDPAQTTDSGMILMGNFLTQRVLETSADGHQTGQLVWVNGPRYEGDLRAEVPHGKGQYSRLNNADFTLTGNFNQGIIEGYAEYVSADESIFYKGTYQSGLFHGQGRYQSHWDGVEFEGVFDEGVFTGEGRQYFRRIPEVSRVKALHPEPEHWIVYEGPFVNDTAHGQGQCVLTEFSYPCTFHEGVLIAIDDVSLLP